MLTATARLRIVGRGTVVAGQPRTTRQSCTAAWVCALPNGRWLVSYRAAREKNSALQQTLVTWSDDAGRSWSTPLAPFGERKVNGKIGQFRAMACTALGGNRVVAALWWVDTSNPARPLFNPMTEGILDSYLFLSFSNDGGQCWSAPARINTTPYDKAPCAVSGPVLVLPDGNWALPYEVQRCWDNPVEFHPASVLSFSSDRGQTWYGAVRPAAHPHDHIYYWDQRPSVLADGTMLNLFWTYDRCRACPGNIHATASGNSGRAWSPVWDTGVLGQPGPARVLPDGRIAMVYVDRTGAPAIKLRLSEDGGKTWPTPTELILHQRNLATQTREKSNLQDMWRELQQYSVGLPDTQSLPNGDLLVTYYTGAHADQTDIAWVRLSFHPVPPRPVAPLGSRRGVTAVHGQVRARDVR